MCFCWLDVFLDQIQVKLFVQMYLHDRHKLLNEFFFSKFFVIFTKVLFLMMVNVEQYNDRSNYLILDTRRSVIMVNDFWKTWICMSIQK